MAKENKDKDTGKLKNKLKNTSNITINFIQNAQKKVMETSTDTKDKITQQINETKEVAKSIKTEDIAKTLTLLLFL